MAQPEVAPVVAAPVVPVAAGVPMQPQMQMQPGMMMQGTMNPMMQPGMMQMRPPPPGVQPGGTYQMVKFCGEKTKKEADCLACVGCLFLPAYGLGLLCCLVSACARNDPKDEKEVYVLHGQYYTPQGTIDQNVGSGGGGRR